jgi:hypothetical protein
MAIASPSPSPDLIKKRAKLPEGIKANSKRVTAISAAAGTGMVAFSRRSQRLGSRPKQLPEKLYGIAHEHS